MGFSVQEARNRATLDAFQGAWAAKDLDGLSRWIADDVVYSASVGPEPGETWRGRAAVMAGFKLLLEHDRGISKSDGIYLSGQFAFASWSYWKEPGNELLTRGCDLFEFRKALILRKDAYRKLRAPSLEAGS